MTVVSTAAEESQRNLKVMQYAMDKCTGGSVPLKEPRFLVQASSYISSQDLYLPLLSRATSTS